MTGLRRRRDGALEGGEEQLQQHVLDTARLLGWLAYHTHDSRHSAEGFPDVVLVRPPRLAFVEVKAWPEGTKKGDPTSAQEEWLHALRRVSNSLRLDASACRPEDLRQAIHAEPPLLPGVPSVEVYVWRWPDWTSGAIERILR